VEGHPQAGAALPLGYFDKKFQSHMMITRRSQVNPALAAGAPGARLEAWRRTMAISKILCPLDFSSTPTAALDIACELAKDGGGVAPPSCTPT